MKETDVMDAEQVMEQYFPKTSRRNLRRYVDQRIIRNNTEAAEEIELTSSTLQRYQKKFREMSPAERTLLVKALAQENYRKHN